MASDRNNKFWSDEVAPITLVSDYDDYYDFYFDYDDPAAHKFYRMRGRDLGHDRVMDVLMKKKLAVPMHGLVKNMRPDKNMLVVVYFGDTESPRDESCQVVPLSEAKVQYPECFAIQYVGRIGPPSSSYRIVHVGERTWCLRYESDHPWSSHQGNVKITMANTSSMATWPREFHLPLYALDYVDDREGQWNTWRRYHKALPYFVDMTKCPVLRETPIEAQLGKEGAAGLIKNWVNRFGSPRD